MKGIVAICAILLLIAGCNLFTDTDDPDIYAGGEVSSVTFQVEGPNTVRINWTETFPDEQGFYIDRKVWDGTWEKKLIQVPAEATTALDTTAVLGTVYYYKVYAYKNDAESVEEQVQYNFYLPAPKDPEYDFSWTNPTRIRISWENLAPWADSIRVSKKIGDGFWVTPYQVLAGDATEFMDNNFNVEVVNTWSIVAYYEEHFSQQALLTLMPPKR